MTIKIGLIGCGGIAVYHARGYLAIPSEARIKAVADVVADNARRMAELAGGARIFADYRALLAEGDVDAVDILLPHHLHADAIVAAAAAGKHVLCEKPLCLTLAEADRVERAVRESGITLMCAHNQLYTPAMRRARELLDAGALGQLYTIRTVDAFYHSWSDPGTSWRSARATMGRGELIDTGYHPTYMLLHLATAAPVEITALLSSHRIHAMDGEDSAQVLVRFADGAVGSIVTSWAYGRPAGAWLFQVVGERGELHGEGDELRHRPRGGEPVVEAFPVANLWEAETADFVACLREGRRPLQSEADGIAALRVILAAYQSDAEKRTVALDGPAGA